MVQICMALSENAFCSECVRLPTELAVVQAQAVSGAADLIHGTINTSSIDALSRHQGVQKLHVMPGGGKHQGGLPLLDGLPDQP